LVVHGRHTRGGEPACASAVAATSLLSSTVLVSDCPAKQDRNNTIYGKVSSSVKTHGREDIPGANVDGLTNKGRERGCGAKAQRRQRD
jgi:hypothetical protein